MKKSTIILLGVIGVLVLLGVSLVSKYNKIVTLEEDIDNKYSEIDVQLKRRADLIPNLVSTVKGYAAHEEKIINDISEARAKMNSANTVKEAAEANDELSTALTNLLVVVENYPDLKANQNFITLQDELAGTENRIAVARKDYNDAVTDYNKVIKVFPNNIMASIVGAEKREYFEVSEQDRENVNVSFE